MNDLRSQADSYFEDKQFSLAETLYRQLVSTHADAEVAILFRLAFCLEMQKKYEEAIVFYENVATSGHEGLLIGDACFRIAFIANSQNAYKKAICYLKQAIDVLGKLASPPSFYEDCFYWLGLNYEAIGQARMALSYYEQIADLDDWYWDVCFRRILCFDKIGQYEESLIQCDQFITRFKNNLEQSKAKALYPKIIEIKQQLEKLFIVR